MQESGIIPLSTEEWVMSLSCHKAIFSKEAIELERTTRAKPQILSQMMGFLLCGMEDEPFCPSANGSSTSRISVLCKFLISKAIFSKVPAMIAKVVRYWACLSLCKIWVETLSGFRPNFLQTNSSTLGLMWAKFPTDPAILPTEIDCMACCNLSWFLCISSYHKANFKPKEVGSACTPWVLPIMGVYAEPTSFGLKL